MLVLGLKWPVKSGNKKSENLPRDLVKLVVKLMY